MKRIFILIAAALLLAAGVAEARKGSNPPNCLIYPQLCI